MSRLILKQLILPTASHCDLHVVLAQPGLLLPHRPSILCPTSSSFPFLRPLLATNHRNLHQANPSETSMSYGSYGGGGGSRGGGGYVQCLDFLSLPFAGFFDSMAHSFSLTRPFCSPHAYAYALVSSFLSVYSLAMTVADAWADLNSVCLSRWSLAASHKPSPNLKSHPPFHFLFTRTCDLCSFSFSSFQLRRRRQVRFIALIYLPSSR